ncbi:MAG: HlyD family efflux transporter periplasmic adaptor subunit [Thermodesulfobacteriota bacterium]
MIFRTYGLAVLAALGFLFALHMVALGNKPQPFAPPVVTPATPPYEHFVAGAGIVEASSENIAVGTPLTGLVSAVLVQAGDPVRQGQPLFRLDDRELKARLAVSEGEAGLARARLARLKAEPRPEDLPALEARVRELAALQEDAERQLAFRNKAGAQQAYSLDELERFRASARTAKARYESAVADLARLKAGAWTQDVAVAEQELAVTLARVEAIRTDLERATVTSPLDGEVLQVKVHPGELAIAGAGSAPLLLLGATAPLHVRVDVDENDAWRIEPGGAAQATLRGNPAVRVDLSFVRFEPYVVPKRSLTGDSAERVDTRVLQVLYAFHREDLPILVGQQMDVFIRANSGTARPAGTSPGT